VANNTLQPKILVPIFGRLLLTRMRNKIYYRRDLPHWIPLGATIFVTWRLFGSLPKESLNQINALRIKLAQKPIPTNADRGDWELQNRKRLFSLYDRMLDKASTGPTWLKIPEIANIVQQTLTVKYASFFTLWSYCVMSNHCHALLHPKILPDQTEPVAFETIMKRIKGYTAKEANAFWEELGKVFGRTSRLTLGYEIRRSSVELFHTLKIIR
jgi:putative transposase